ncbi:MAG: UDP-N-acetylmuramoyl-L-alanyl-D-glutamate--2,6-diaminopimelate ligase [Porticoccus sp.]|nr:UDP-N-acetylmuramoyl-L-alanyl-D-glutamate--2,6-diaminopimelate ligase [Porticoccus sp.]
MSAPFSPVECTLQQLLPDVILPQALTELPVAGLSLDSRSVKSGEIFIALPGGVKDGRDYIDQALANGAAAVLAEAEGLDDLNPRVISISHLNQKLSGIAGRFYGDPSDQLSLTGITGTNGKTTCSQLLAQVFSLVGAPSGAIGTLGYGVVTKGHSNMTDTGMTTPDAITVQAILAEYAADGVDHVAMEVSSHSLDQSRVAGVSFDTAIFTNLSRDHLDYHGDLVSYAGAKMQLFAMPDLANAVVNVDDPVGSEIALQLASSINVCGYSLLNNNASIFAKNIVLSGSGLRALVLTPWGEGEINSSLLGKFNLQNLLAVIGAACLQGVSLDDVLRVVPHLQSVPGRMELISIDVGPQVVVDYAHTPDALEKVLETLREHCSSQLWCVFGCGGDRDRGKRAQMGNIASRYADHVVITNDNPRSESAESIAVDIREGLAKGATAITCLDRAEAIRTAVDNAGDNDIVLIAGKGHEEYQLLGTERLPFSDQVQARLALRQRGGPQ